MFWFKKQPTKWQLLANEILNTDLYVIKATDDIGNWYLFVYNGAKYRILSDTYIGKEIVIHSYNFEVYIDQFSKYSSCADFFKKETMRKIYNHALGIYNRQQKTIRMNAAEQQIFGKESNEST
jgi:hypothetical protein